MLKGRLARRILINYRVDPARLAPLLPAPLRPLLWRGWGVAGICLLRLESLRPEGLPEWVGLASESAAHRIAVAWEEAGRTRTGVYVLRRDTAAWLPHLVGSRLFPGRFHRARFDVKASENRWDLRMAGEGTTLDLSAHRASTLPAHSVFQDGAEASAFFQSGALGWSEGRRGLEGLRLEMEGWNLQPLDLDRLHASFFEDRARFPEGSLAWDSAFLMERLPVRWMEDGRMEGSCAC